MVKKRFFYCVISNWKATVVTKLPKGNLLSEASKVLNLWRVCYNPNTHTHTHTHKTTNSRK